MTWRWVKRRRLTIGLVASFASWYLVQRYVLHAFGGETAIWWFYFDGALSPGYLLAPISHDMSDTGHLRRNVTILLMVGSVAEPGLERERYAAALIGMSIGSIAFANLLSMAFGTRWILAGASGGIFGLWAYLGMKNRRLISEVLNSDNRRRIGEAAVIALGVLTPIVVPTWDLYSTGTLNVSHAVGVLLGYAIALVEVPPEIEVWVKKRIG